MVNMEHQLTSEIVKVLDYIIDKTISNGSIFSDELKSITPYFGDIREIKNSDYKPYFEILGSYNIVEITTTLGNGYKASPKLTITRQFQQNGGFKQLYEDQQKEIKHQIELKDITFKKLKSDTKLVELQLKSFWWLFAVAVVGGICGIISLIISINH
jgi:hypothetical protein